MVTSSVIVSRRRGRMACVVHAVPDWEGFEKLARFLERYYSATIVERVDGPDARRWTIAVRGTMIELQHEDPWGNVIVAADSSAEAVVEEVADDLRSRLAGLPPNGE